MWSIPFYFVIINTTAGFFGDSWYIAYYYYVCTEKSLSHFPRFLLLVFFNLITIIKNVASCVCKCMGVVVLNWKIHNILCNGEIYPIIFPLKSVQIETLHRMCVWTDLRIYNVLWKSCSLPLKKIKKDKSTTYCGL